MKISTTSQTDKRKKRIYSILAAAFWILIWEALAVKIGSQLIIASPLQVAKTLSRLVFEASTWKALGFSLLRIGTGFLTALVMGSLFAVASSRITAIKMLLAPITSVIKTTPVASFVILAIIWFGSSNLSIFISFLMVFPVIYLNLLKGIESFDKELSEMAKVFEIPITKRIKYIYMPQILPFLVSACSVALGLCWKSGVAAEVIGISSGSIGEMLYRAKLYFETGDLLAWTVLIICLSTGIEKLVMLLLGRISTLPGRSYKAVKQKIDKAKEASEAPALSVKGVCKSFGSQDVLKDVSFEIPKGSHAAIMGRSGAGKTTLSRIIMGLEKPDSGEVLLKESKAVGCVFQEDRLVSSLNPLGNIAIAGGDEKEAYDLLKSFGFTDELIFKPASELSGGEKRRVAVARALLCGSGLVIMDEPFKGIDNETLFNDVLPKVGSLTSDKTLILITHSEEESERLCGCRINIE